MEERRLQLQVVGLHHHDETEEKLNGQDTRLDVIGEELSEKEEQEEEEEEVVVEEEEQQQQQQQLEQQLEQQDEELERATQDC